MRVITGTCHFKVFFSLRPVILPLGIDLQIDFFFVSKLRIAVFHFRSQFTRGLVIVLSFIKVADESAMVLARGRLDGMAMIALFACFKNCASEIFG